MQSRRPKERSPSWFSSALSILVGSARFAKSAYPTNFRSFFLQVISRNLLHLTTYVFAFAFLDVVSDASSLAQYQTEKDIEQSKKAHDAIGAYYEWALLFIIFNVHSKLRHWGWLTAPNSPQLATFTLALPFLGLNFVLDTSPTLKALARSH